MCDDLSNYGAVEETLLPYNKIRNKFEILSGDMIQRGNNHKIVLLSSKAIKHKNEQLFQAIQSSVSKQLSIKIEQVKGEMEGMSPEEQEQFVQQMEQSLNPTDIKYKNFSTDVEMYKQKMLRHTFYDQEVLDKKVDSLKDVVIGDRMFLYTGWKHGRPYIDVCNPLFCGFLKSQDTKYVQNGDYFYYVDEPSVGEILDEYLNKLDKKDLEKLLGNSDQGGKLSKDHYDKLVYDRTTWNSTREIFDRQDGSYSKNKSGIGLHQTTSDGYGSNFKNKNKRITRVHMEFKAYREVMFYSYIDEYGEKLTVMLDKNADIIPDEAEKVKYYNELMEESFKYIWADETGATNEVSIMWIPRRYELTRLGSDVYVDMREVPFQPNNVQQPFSKFELSYKGGIVNSRNAKSISLLQAGLPIQMQIIVAKHLQNKEMAKYQGFVTAQDVDQIPDELAMDEEGNPIEGTDKLTQSEIIQRKTGKIYYSATRTSNGLPPPPNRGAGVNVFKLGDSNEFVNLQNYISLLDRELGVAMGIPPQREAQVVPYTTASDNQQALQSSYLATELYFYWHNKVWTYALDEHLANIDTFYKRYFALNPDSKDHLVEYITEDGTKELIKILPEYLDHADIGLFIGSNSGDQTYIQYMLQNIQPIAQNAGEGAGTLSTILRAITSGEPAEKIHRMIQMESDKQNERMEQRAAQEEQMIEKNKESQRELMKYQSDLELEKAITIEKIKGENWIKQTEIDATKFAQQYDINQNMINDNLEKEKMKLDADKVKLDKTIASQEKIAEGNRQTQEKINKETLAAQERIAKENKKNNSNK